MVWSCKQRSRNFPNPDQFDIERANADKHLAFGIGRHTCIGKPVALMQLEESYKQILTRFPNIHMVEMESCTE